MGCCTSNTEQIMTNPEQYVNGILCKKRSSCKFELFAQFERENVDKNIANAGTFQTNALGLSILIPDVKLLRFLHTHLKASFETLEAQLLLQGIQLIQLLIDNFNEDVMKYYLTLYPGYDSTEDFINQEQSLDLYGTAPQKITKKVHPMHYAVETENLEFMKFIVKYFKKNLPPDCFDIHAIDEETGENCALLACREGSLLMVEYLHSQKCDFELVNKNGENAINLALVPKRPGKARVNVLPYLIEEVKLDITENYEETLLLSKHPSITEYIEERLKMRKIFVSKLVVETMYKVPESGQSGNESPVKDRRLSNLSLISPIDTHLSGMESHENLSFEKI